MTTTTPHAQPGSHSLRDSLPAPASVPAPVPAPTASGRPRGGRFGREVGYLLSGLPLGIAAFTLMIVGFALGVSTLILVIGLPVLAGTLAMARYLARVEADHIAVVTGRPLPARWEEPASRGAGAEAGSGGGRWKAVRDPQAWRDLAHAVLSFPVRVATFALSLTWLVGGLGGLTYGLWSWSIPRDDNDGLMDLAFGISGRGPDIAFNTALGVFLLVTAVPVVRGLTVAQASLGRVLLRRAQV
ncbi:sensor domain-containing protein [Streptomyces spirodelae]|uniref:Sensor domain-containing protein n=1 Tax=Streptomyces spirodelae TaxID=2812904 RepID=A0ABS3WU73_9ACTN|nr:sensor domain-containing protein [Streptomyces spirodelae]MBO8186676.1 sensor domain-containing protein [Streptomyces spirodelae]